jgi:hypothetical protein
VYHWQPSLVVSRVTVVRCAACAAGCSGRSLLATEGGFWAHQKPTNVRLRVLLLPVTLFPASQTQCEVQAGAVIRYTMDEVLAAVADRTPVAMTPLARVFRTTLREELVAVKVVNLAGLDGAFKARLAGEIELLATARHRNIVQLRGCVS